MVKSKTKKKSKKEKSNSASLKNAKNISDIVTLRDGLKALAFLILIVSMISVLLYFAIKATRKEEDSENSQESEAMKVEISARSNQKFMDMRQEVMSGSGMPKKVNGKNVPFQLFSGQIPGLEGKKMNRPVMNKLDPNIRGPRDSRISGEVQRQKVMSESKAFRSSKGENMVLMSDTWPQDYDYSEMPSLGRPVDYNMNVGASCEGSPSHHLLDMTMDMCQGVCTRDENCVAFTYDVVNGDCFTFDSACTLKPADPNRMATLTANRSSKFHKNQMH